MKHPTWTGRRFTIDRANGSFLRASLPTDLSAQLIDAGYDGYDVEVTEDGIVLRPRKLNGQHPSELPKWED